LPINQEELLQSFINFWWCRIGKTLAHAIGVEIKDKYPEKTVLYISAEIFTQQYIDSVKKTEMILFIFIN
jgi:hypothetical protein